MTKVLLDTNMFIAAFELKLDILQLIQEKYGATAPFTLDIVLKELQKEGKKYAFARKLAESVPIEAYDGSEHSVDSALLDYAERHSVYIATQDAELSARAKRKHLKTLGIRQKKYLGG